MQGEAEFPNSCTGTKATDISEVFPPALLALNWTQDYAWLA